jgi:hypothetical protein
MFLVVNGEESFVNAAFVFCRLHAVNVNSIQNVKTNDFFISHPQTNHSNEHARFRAVDEAITRLSEWLVSRRRNH